jgi:gluconokinase
MLNLIGADLADPNPNGTLVAACSALKRCYRDAIRKVWPQTTFVQLNLDPAVVGERLQQRPGHFVPAKHS